MQEIRKAALSPASPRSTACPHTPDVGISFRYTNRPLKSFAAVFVSRTSTTIAGRTASRTSASDSRCSCMSPSRLPITAFNRVRSRRTSLTLTTRDAISLATNESCTPNTTTPPGSSTRTNSRR